MIAIALAKLRLHPIRKNAKEQRPGITWPLNPMKLRIHPIEKPRRYKWSAKTPPSDWTKNSMKIGNAVKCATKNQCKTATVCRFAKPELDSTLRELHSKGWKIIFQCSLECTLRLRPVLSFFFLPSKPRSPQYDALLASGRPRADNFRILYQAFWKIYCLSTDFSR